MPQCYGSCAQVVKLPAAGGVSDDTDDTDDADDGFFCCIAIWPFDMERSVATLLVKFVCGR